MKKLIAPLMLLVIAGTALAQGNYEQSMQSLKAQFIAAESKHEFIDLKNRFSRIAAVETSEWLPCYYETLCTLAWAFEEEDATTQVQLVAQIGEMLDELESQTGPNVEVDVLRGRWLQYRSGLPFEDYMRVGMELFEFIPAIVEAHPNHPRGLLLLGEIIVFSPAGFMGYDNEDAYECFRKAATVLSSIDQASTIEPTWGMYTLKGYLDRYNISLAEEESTVDPGQPGQEALDNFYNAGGAVNYKKAVQTFSALAKEYPEEAALVYHHAFTLIQVALTTDELVEVDVYCDQAEAVLDATTASLSKDEHMVLRSLICSARIRVDFKARGLRYYMASEQLLGEGLAANPNNPRLHYLKGCNQLQLPEDVGGGITAAQPHFEQAAQLCEQDVQSTIDVRWGCTENQAILTKYYK